MKISKLKLSSTDLNQIINLLKQNLSFEYQNQTDKMSILASEEYYFRNKSTQMNMIVLKKDESSLFIDIIGGAGGTGLLNISLGSEKGYIKKVKKVLCKYLEDNGIAYEEIQLRS